MHNFFANVKYAFRQFKRAPVFTFAAVLTLSLGIGGTTAIFSLIHTIMLKSLPVKDPAQLYRVGDGNECCVEGGPRDHWGMFSYPLYQRLLENMPEFEEVTAFQSIANSMSVRRQSDTISMPHRVEFVSGTYFSTLGISSFAGRVFTPSDDQPSATPVAVMSYRAWQTVYGSDPKAIGATYFLDGHPFTVVGVTPPGFFGETLRSDPAEFFVPLQHEPLIRGESSLLYQPITTWLRVIGRLKPGASTAGMDARLTTVLRRWLETDSGFPPALMPEIRKEIPKQNIRVVPAGAGVASMKEDYGRSLRILLAVCGLVLLIACANVANLMLARAAGRRGQTALRLAIGASRRQIVTQAITESVLLSVIGGIAGLAVAIGASRLLLALAFHSAHFLPISTIPAPMVLLFSFGLSLLSGVIFGTAPAWFVTHTNPVEALRGASRTTQDSSSPARKVLLILQATLAVVLVAGATMLARSLGNLERQNFGFETANRIMVQMNTPVAGYTPEKLNALYREMEARLGRLPGVEQVGIAMYTPLTDNWGEGVVIEGHKPIEHSNASWDRVSAGFLASVGQPIVRGRGFTDADNENTAPVAIVNETFAKRFLPNEDPIDQHFGMDVPELAGTYRIVGVVRDAKYTDPRSPTRAMFFVPLMQWVKGYKLPIMEKIELWSHFAGGLILVTHNSPGTLEPLIARTLAELDPNISLMAVRPLEEQVSTSFEQERSVAALAGMFGVVALILAAIGLYGVTAYTVAQRTSEIGVRMALGADRVNVVQLILHGAFRRVMIGLAIGIPLAIGAGRLLAAQLWGVKSWDPLALSVAAISLAVCAFLAAIIPALRAAAIEPMQALRFE